MRAPTTPPIVLLLVLACLALLAEAFFVPPIPAACPGRPIPATHHPWRRHIIRQASASAASAPFPPINVELLRASLRLLGTHERQKAQDWEDSLLDAGRELALAKLMAQVCDTRLALLGGYACV